MSKGEPKIIIHFGAGKTGSSAIQHFLLHNAETLLRHGFHYPKHRVDPNGVSGGHSITQPLRKGNTQAVLGWVKKEYNYAQRKQSHLIVSGEYFYTQAQHILPIFRKITNNIEAIGYFRHPAEFVVSSYNQGVKRHYDSRTLLENIENMLKGKPAVAYRGDYLFDWIECVGQENTKIYPYDKEIFGETGIEYHFLDLIDIPKKKHPEFEKPNRRINKSYTPSAVNLKRELNKILDKDALRMNQKIDQALQRFSDLHDEPGSKITDLLSYEVFKKLEDHFSPYTEKIKTQIFPSTVISYWEYQESDFKSELPLTDVSHPPLYVFLKALRKNPEVCEYLKTCFLKADKVSENLIQIREQLFHDRLDKRLIAFFRSLFKPNPD